MADASYQSEVDAIKNLLKMQNANGEKRLFFKWRMYCQSGANDVESVKREWSWMVEYQN